MLDLKFVLANLETVREALDKRFATVDLQPLVELDGERRQTILDVEALKKERNDASRSIGQRMKAGEDVSEVREQVRGIGDRIKELDERQKQIESEIETILETIPNLVDPSCPVGEDESFNRVERTWGEKPSFTFQPRDHVDLGEINQTLDFERAAKLTGARFAVHFDLGARLKRALVNFMVDLHTEVHGYREVIPPFIVNRESLYGTGQLPKFEEDLFRLQNPDDWYLIPTAEVPVTNLHRGEILNPEDLPIKYTAFTPCFRAEAGSHGRDVRGLIRQHQFYKVELVTFARAEESDEILEQLTGHAEEVLKRLGLHYRVVTLATGDLSFSSAKTYDLEVWLPSQDTYREISSCSNFRDFQARRAGIRYRPAEGGKPRFVHTLNGSGLAVGRTVVAILDQMQQEDGSFLIPDVLKPYMESRL